MKQHSEEKISNNDLHPGCLTRQAQALLTALLVVFISPAATETKTGVPERSQRQTSFQASGRSRNHATSQPRCETKGEEQIVITCSYRPAPGPASHDKSRSRIAVTRAVISFRPDDSSNMRAELTFTNTGTVRSPDARTVYLEIDADAGNNNNYVRRSLPTVDFRKLSPGKAVTFSEQLRVAAFPPGHYTIALWIPSSEPALKFNPAQNFLISSAGVPDPQTGLNILAKFTVERRHY